MFVPTDILNWALQFFHFTDFCERNEAKNTVADVT